MHGRPSGKNAWPEQNRLAFVVLSFSVGCGVCVVFPFAGFHRNGVHVAGRAGGNPGASALAGSVSRDCWGLSRLPHISTRPVAST
jgi:hypothetical protein